MKEINCPKCNQHIKILGTDYDLYKENLLKKDNEIERLKEEYMILQNASDEVEEEKDKEIERLNNDIKELFKENSNKEKVIIAQDNIIKDIKSQLDYLETYSSKEDVFEDMKRRLDRIEKIIGSDKE